MVVLLFVGGAETEEREGFTERRGRGRGWGWWWTAKVTGVREEEEGRGRRKSWWVSGEIRVMVNRIRLEPICEEIGMRISHGEERKREKRIVFTLVGFFIQEDNGNCDGMWRGRERERSYWDEREKNRL